MAEPLSKQPMQAAAPAAQGAPGEKTCSADLVRAVTQKVYAMLLRDLKIERERLGQFGRRLDRPRGGR